MKTIHPTAQIGPFCLIGENVSIGENSRIGAHSVIEEGASIGKNCHIDSFVQIRHNCNIKDHVSIRSKSVIGSEGFGYAQNQKFESTFIPQLGAVTLSGPSVFGSFLNMDRGAFTDTSFASNTILASRIHIAHNVHMEKNCRIRDGFMMAGSTDMGEGFFADVSCVVAGHMKIPHQVHLGVNTRLTTKTSPNSDYVGTPPMKPSLQNEVLKLFKEFHILLVEDSKEPK